MENPSNRALSRAGACTSLSYPMAIMSASFVSPVLRCNSDVTSLGGMAVPTFQVTTVMLKRNKGQQGNTRAQKGSLSSNPVSQGACLGQNLL